MWECFSVDRKMDFLVKSIQPMHRQWFRVNFKVLSFVSILQPRPSLMHNKTRENMWLEFPSIVSQLNFLYSKIWALNTEMVSGWNKINTGRDPRPFMYKRLNCYLLISKFEYDQMVWFYFFLLFHWSEMTPTLSWVSQWKGFLCY